jgi:DNA topoisomerase-2
MSPLVILDNKVRFIIEIIEGKLRVQNRKKVDILADLRAKGYKSFPKNEKADATATETANEEDDVENDTDHGYDYLLSMSIWSLSVEKVKDFSNLRNV